MIKPLAILSYFLAFVALQAHNALPHHHHAEIEMNEHHDEHHDDGKDDAPFNVENHDPAFGKLIVKPEGLNSEIEKPVCLVNHFFHLFDQIATIDHWRPNPPPHYDSALHSIFLLHDVGLRAPPAPLA